MRIGVLGTGMVGQTIGTKLVSVGQEVKMGSRVKGNDKAIAWVQSAGTGAGEGTFADAAQFADEIVINATAGTASIDALSAAGSEHLAGKILVDISNPLDFSAGFPPLLSVCNDDSMGEQIQNAFPDTRVVKSLNTMNAKIMVEPSLVPGSHNAFVAGNDADAKRAVISLLESFGWPPKDIIDLGDITASRGVEMFLPLWLRLYGSFDRGSFNIAVMRG
ncbi:MAG: NADPH-dependent F420 reductase [Actinomycetota bacterium]|nr:NAD(P)-binding domain-containing protein [Actinomycetota bacterium]